MTFAENSFCPIDDNYMNSITNFLTDPATNPLFPIGRTIPILYLFFERNAADLGLTWDGPVRWKEMKILYCTMSFRLVTVLILSQGISILWILMISTLPFHCKEISVATNSVCLFNLIFVVFLLFK